MATLRRWAPTLLKGLLAALVVLFIARSLPLKTADIAAFLLRANDRFYASMLLFAIFLMLQAGIWVMIVNAAGSGSRPMAEPDAPKLGLLPGLRIFIDSQFAKYIPGGFWNYAGRIALATRAGVPLGAQLSAIVYENVLLVSAAIAYALLLAVCLNVAPIPLLLAALVVLLVAYRFYDGITSGVYRLLARASRWKPLRKPLAKAFKPFAAEAKRDGAAAPGLTRNRFFGYFACFLGSHFVMGIAFWMLTNSFGAGKIGLLYAAGTFATSWLLGLFSPLPGGLGVREGFLVYFLSLKVGQEAALQISVIARLWNMMAEAVFWALIQAASQLTKRVKRYES